MQTCPPQSGHFDIKDAQYAKKNGIFNFYQVYEKLYTCFNIVSQFHVLNFNTFREINRQRASRTGQAELILLKNLAVPKMLIIYFSYFC